MRRAAALLLTLLAVAQAQTCRSELERVAVLAGPRPGLRAAALLHEAHRLVEPAFPPWRRLEAEALPLAADAPGFEDVRYLAERRLLGDGWQRDELDAASWQQMIDRFTRGYGLERVVVREPVGLDSMIDDAVAALTAVAGAVRPAALIATDQQDGETLVFLAALWNWTPHPRLLLLNPTSYTLADGVGPLLSRVGGCALRFEHFILARERTAARLFLGNNDAAMTVVGGDPERPELWPRAVAAGEELATLSFTHPELTEFTALSIEFGGPSLGIFEALGLFARVRTNLSPTGLLYYLTFPPAP